MVHFGFSYIGVIFLAMLFIPNGIWAKNKPADYDKYVGNENKILLVLERIGEVGNCILAVIFSDFNPRPFTLWSLWLIASCILMVLYDLYWIRYFRSPKTMADMYSSFAGFPVAGASLPCVAFLFLAIYGSNIFLIISTLILSVGHIGIHLMHRNEVVPKKKSRRIVRVLKVLAAIPVALIFILIFVAIAGRNISWFSNFIDPSKGICESVYVPIGGQEQYMLIRGKDITNPVILYLHGGPGGPDSPISNVFTDPLIDDYTVVCWDQRGCGRTYFRNSDDDPYNTSVDYFQALADLNEVVDYLRDRFGQDRIILMGHSYGTTIGSSYIRLHSDKISAFIGIGLCVNTKESDTRGYEDAIQAASAAGLDTSEIEAARQQYLNGDSLADYMALRNATMPYHPAEYSANTVALAVFSPYAGIDDIRWVMKQMDMDSFFELEQPLMYHIFEYNICDSGTDYDIPVFYVMGSRDFVCNASMAREYYEEVSAPVKDYAEIPGCGHTPHYERPEEWAAVVRGFLAEI